MIQTSESPADFGRCWGALETLDLCRRRELLGTWATVCGREDAPPEEDLGDAADLGVPEAEIIFFITSAR